MQSKHIVLIVSAISTCNAPLAYTPTRSAFTHSERFQQTLVTIDKVRHAIPDSFIVLIEGTPISEEWMVCLQEKVGYLHKAYEDESVLSHIHGPHKGMGEVSSILSYLNSYHFQSIQTDCLSLTKISGRYYPTSNFKWEFKENGILCHLKKDNPHHPTGLWMSTMFYTVGHLVLNDYMDSLKECIQSIELQEGIAFEHVLPNCFQKKNINIFVKKQFYVGGEYGPWGGYVEH